MWSVTPASNIPGSRLPPVRNPTNILTGTSGRITPGSIRRRPTGMSLSKVTVGATASLCAIFIGISRPLILVLSIQTKIGCCRSTIRIFWHCKRNCRRCYISGWIWEPTVFAPIWPERWLKIRMSPKMTQTMPCATVVRKNSGSKSAR